jgi:LmbE family N-acetylglucosaminyl deacetylase
VDGVMREHVGWQEWMITTRIDATRYWETAWKAVQCHSSQLVGMMSALNQMTPEIHQRVWGKGTFYRAFSRVNGGRQVEQDLFEGIG